MQPVPKKEGQRFPKEARAFALRGLGLLALVADLGDRAADLLFTLATSDGAKHLAIHFHGDHDLLIFRRRHGRRGEVATS